MKRLRVAYDPILRRPGSIELAMRLGATVEGTLWFDKKHWLHQKTEHMVVRELTYPELRHLVYLTEAHANRKQT